MRMIVNDLALIHTSSASPSVKLAQENRMFAPRSIRLALLVVLALFVATSSTDIYAKGSKSGSSSGTKTVHVKGYTTKKGTYVPAHDRKAPTKHKGTASAGTTSTTHTATGTSTAAKRDAKGRIARSEAAKHAFMKQTGYPN